ncbi:MAG TPA: prolyl oligopeptidase family serine peptidase [Burkholderiaceae bacterium]|nr:prolyl oligopeptidase family serine peptidase [Burkholderiaceae bacterium]
MHPLASLLAAVVAAVLAAACSAPPPAPSDDTLAANANLVAQGIAPVPNSLVRQVERYTQFSGHSFVAWHPTRREMLVAHRKAGAGTTQIFRLASPMGALEQLTDFGDPVSSASYEPQQGRYIVFARGSGGNEVTQLYRMDLDTRNVTLLTDPAERHESLGWLHHGARLLATSVPLDRTAQEGSRTEVQTRLWLIEPMDPTSKRRVADLPGTGWSGGAVSGDDRQVALTHYLSATESQVWLLELDTGALRQVLPATPAEPRAAHFVSAFAPDNRGLYVISDRAGEFRELWLQPLNDAPASRVTAHIPWDVAGAEVSHDGSFVALRANVEARHELRLFDGRTQKEIPLAGLPAGSVQSVQFHEQRQELAFAVNSAQSPSTLYSMDPRSGRIEAWTRPTVPPGLNPGKFPDPQTVRWTSFDGRSISGLRYLPPATFTGKRPVVILIHGGPEAQATVGFMARYNYLVNELGVAVIQPNVRGSAGFGKTFLSLDDGMKREDSVKDIGALLDWIATQPQLDASRVLVMGGSYGGYMALAVSVHHADRIAGAIDTVGISHFVTFLTRTESYRRDLRRVEYGDERDPAMRAFLDRISPLTNAERIRKPLFVVQGKNDPRVPYTEAEQIVAKVRGNGTPVWYLRAENEGHGFARKENADYLFYASLVFMQNTLLK